MAGGQIMTGAQTQGAALIMGDDMAGAVGSETVVQLVAQAFQKRIRDAGIKVDPGLPALIKQNGCKHDSDAP